LRKTGVTGGAVAPVRDDFQGSDESYLLAHNKQVPPDYFMTLPNEYGDDFYNVRFQSPVDPFYIVGVYLPLFGMAGITGGPAGTPAVKISVFESGNNDLDSSGFPTDFVASRDFPYSNEHGDTLLKLCKADTVVWNFLDMRPANIGFQERNPFHIAVSSISDQATDTVAIFHDDGRGMYSSDYSGFWDGQDSVWAKWRYVPGIRLGLNFFIMVVISDTPNDTSSFPPISVVSADHQPGTLLLDPAFPNPFNNRTSLQFSVPDASPYQVRLFDHLGRQVSLLGEGVGGSGMLALDAASLSAGTYFVIMTTPNGSLTQPIHLIK